MLELPSVDVDNLERLADWAELCALTRDEHEVALGDIADVLRDGGLAGSGKGDYFQGDPNLDDEDSLSEEEAAEALAEVVLEQCRGRLQLLGDCYPFDVADDMLRTRDVDTKSVAAYLMLLIVDVAYHYSDLGDIVTPDSDSSRLFEKIVEASMFGLLGGPCARFGWPREPGWPTGIDERIGELGTALGLGVELLDDKTDPADKDRGLDVVGRALFYDEADTTYVVLAQCATGRSNWKSKRGEPSIQAWGNVLQWHSRLLRAIALPWRLEGNWNRRRTHMFFEAIVLDRPRLLAGCPDSTLDETIRDEVFAWCEARIADLPALE